MDKISGLPDELLVKILSFVPTKVAVSTCVLSKRWEFLWMWLPRLEFITEYGNLHLNPGLRYFIDKKLPLQKPPVIESLLLKLFLDSHIKPEDIKRWIDIAVSRYVRELEIDYFPRYKTALPSSLFSCKSLVILKIVYGVLGDVLSSMAFLPSLKTLQLKHVEFVDGKLLQQLLSRCPVLEDLSVQFCDDDNLREFTIIVPSLQSLSLVAPMDWWQLDGYEIDTPSLKYLKLVNSNHQKHYSLIKNMPKLREAYVDVGHSNLNIVIGSITSVKHLTICNEDVYGDGFVFNQLEHLKLYVDQKDSSNFLGRLLKVSPNLQVLEISVRDVFLINEHSGTGCSNPSVPECLLSSLQIFKWSRYLGRPQDRDIAVYILKNACHLKKATILTDTRFVPKLQMIKELTLSPRASSTCQLVFAEDFDIET